MTTWDQVHVGDTVRGADQRPWLVMERGAARGWLGGKREARFALHCPTAVTTDLALWRTLSDPVEVLALSPDRAEVAAAAQALINGGLPFEILEEKMTADPFASAAVQPEFDRYNRYVLPDPATGEKRAWTRVSTIARTLADEYNLTQWKLRQVAKGMSVRPDLVASAAAADPVGDKKMLQNVAQQAMDAAESSKGANLGNAFHNFTQTLDRGEKLGYVPPPLDKDVAAYQALLKVAGLRVRMIERIVVIPSLGVAGEFDRIYEQPPGDARAEPLTIGDLKSGKDVAEFAGLEIAIQQALYSRGTHIWNPHSGAYEPMPPVDQNRALIVHAPIGQASPQLYGVDIAKGWAAVQCAMEVRRWRNEGKRLMWLVQPQDPAAVALHRVRAATSRADLARLWEELHPRGLWTEEINAEAQTVLAAATV